MLSVFCSEEEYKWRPLCPVVGSVNLHIANRLCGVSYYRFNDKTESKSKDKLFSWPESQRLLI
jgi:hypothetical protein